MNCTEYAVLLEKYLEGSASPADETQLRRHEDACPACRAQRAALDTLQEDLTALSKDVPPLPEGFHQGWMTRVEEEAMEKKNPVKSPRQWTRFLSAAAAVVFVLGGTLLTRDTLAPAKQRSEAQYSLYATEESYDYSASNGIMMANYDSASANTAGGTVMMRSAKTAAAPASAAPVQEKKIIRSVNLTIGTQAYDDSLAALKARCTEMEGWIASSSESVTGNGSRRAYLNLRIPSASLDAFLEGAGSLGRITNRDEYATDVTESYYDTQSRLDTQLALMARLQALVTDAADLSDLLALESQIADTQYEIDRLQSSLNSTDRQVDYATVDISLKEETAATDITDNEKNLGQRLLSALETGAEAFLSFLADMLVFLTAALPFIAIVAVVWLGARLIRKIRKK